MTKYTDDDTSVILGALAWLLGHYECGSPELKSAVTERIIAVLEKYPNSLQDAKNFRSAFPVKKGKRA